MLDSAGLPVTLDREWRPTVLDSAGLPVMLVCE